MSMITLTSTRSLKHFLVLGREAVVKLSVPGKVCHVYCPSFHMPKHFPQESGHPLSIKLGFFTHSFCRDQAWHASFESLQSAQPTSLPSWNTRWCASGTDAGETCNHFVAVHFSVCNTGQPTWLLPPSSSPPIFMLQNKMASPLAGFTDEPMFPHRENKSLLLFTGIVAIGNTVSPPSCQWVKEFRCSDAE